MVMWYIQGDNEQGGHWSLPIKKRARISGADFIIGRDSACDLVLEAPSVSRYHASIRISVDSLYLRDLDSRNGLFRNGVRLNGEVRVQSGDRIELGEVTIAFEYRPSEVDTADATIIHDKHEEQAEGFYDRYQLSDREREVLYHLLQGSDTRRIADILCLAPGSVKNHLLRIYRKTGVHTRAELVTLYHRT